MLIKFLFGLRLFFKEIEVEEYYADIDPEVSLMEQPLLPETKQILGMLYCYYWSKEEDIKDIPDDVIRDARKMKDEIFDGCPPEKFFEDAKKRREEYLNKSDDKKPWYKRIFK